jgi:LPXTG-motif cell wall-anchored protein
VNGSYTDLGLPDDDVEVLPEGAELPDGFTVVIENVDTSGEHATFDWKAFVADGEDDGTDPDPFGIVLVQVKASDGGNRYTYDPAAVADTGMVSPMSSISHVDFCFPLPETQVGGGDDGGETTGSTGETTDGTNVAATTGGSDPELSPSIDETVQDPSVVEGELFVDPAPTLPRTGTDDYSLALAGVALLLIGGTTLLGRRVVLLDA